MNSDVNGNIMRNLELQIAAAETLNTAEQAVMGPDPMTYRNETRAKYLKAFFSPMNGVTVIAASGDGAGGQGGQGSGNDGNGKKDHPSAVFSHAGTESEPNDKMTTADARRDEKNENEEDKEGEDLPLRLFADENGLEYVQPTGYEDALKEFTQYKWPNRVDTIDELKISFERDKRCVLYVAQDLLLLREDFEKRKSGMLRNAMIGTKRNRRKRMARCIARIKQLEIDFKENDDISARLKNLDNLKYAKLFKPEIKKLKDDLLKLVTGNENVDSLEEKILETCNCFLGYYRYTVEFKKESYRSRIFTADSFIQVLGEKSIYDTFFHKDGRLKIVIDFGSGCGENMMQLADGVAQATIKKFKDEIDRLRRELRPSMMRAVYEEWQKNRAEYPDNPWLKLEDEVQKRIVQAIDLEGIEASTLNRLPDIQNHFICIDQTEEALKRARMHKITGIKADICAKWPEFQNQTRLEPEKADIILTSLTLDRAKSKRNLAGNIYDALADGGTAVFALNPEYTMENDGVQGNERAINYGTAGDWDLTSIDVVDYMKKLLPMLKTTGFTPVRLGRHKGKVISSDSETDPKKEGYGPQEYNLLLVICKKEKAKVNPADTAPVPADPAT